MLLLLLDWSTPLQLGGISVDLETAAYDVRSFIRVGPAAEEVVVSEHIGYLGS